jgi:hypothetical protein
MNPKDAQAQGPESSARLGEPLTPVERLAMELEQTNHQDEADALLLLDCVFRHMLRDGGPYTEDGQKFSDMLLEALESWLPETLKIVDA